jgi:hypothetical protein
MQHVGEPDKAVVRNAARDAEDPRSSVGPLRRAMTYQEDPVYEPRIQRSSATCDETGSRTAGTNVQPSRYPLHRQ